MEQKMVTAEQDNGLEKKKYENYVLLVKYS